MNTYWLSNLYYHIELVASVDSLQAAIGNDKDSLTTEVSYKLNLRGPSVLVQTSCSTSLVAVHFACQSLLTDECDMALAGGVSIHVPEKSGLPLPGGRDHRPGRPLPRLRRRRQGDRQRQRRRRWWCSSASPTRWPTATTSTR